jgi:hypothetical protein
MFRKRSRCAVVQRHGASFARVAPLLAWMARLLYPPEANAHDVARTPHDHESTDSAASYNLHKVYKYIFPIFWFSYTSHYYMPHLELNIRFPIWSNLRNNVFRNKDLEHNTQIISFFKIRLCATPSLHFAVMFSRLQSDCRPTW